MFTLITGADTITGFLKRLFRREPLTNVYFTKSILVQQDAVGILVSFRSGDRRLHSLQLTIRADRGEQSIASTTDSAAFPIQQLAMNLSLVFLVILGI